MNLRQPPSAVSRSRLLLSAVLALSLLSAPLALAQVDEAGSEGTLTDLRDRLVRAEERIRALEGAPSTAEDAGQEAMELTEGGGRWIEFGALGGGASVGGYLDLEYRDGRGSAPSFVQHRFVTLIDASFHDKLHFAAEIEFEYGGSDAAGDDGETKVEFAAMDWKFDETFTLRAGAILVPLGRFNLKHDSPLNDFTDRPLVSRSVIPTTLTDAGIGGLGSFSVGEEGVLHYEAYFLNGFEGLEVDATTVTGFASNFDTSSGIRGGRPSLKVDGSQGIATAGRVAWSPHLGVELGVSSHFGAYDSDGDRDLWVSALDFELEGAAIADFLSGFGVNGEIARADIERDAIARASGVPDDLWGFVVEVRHEFMPHALHQSAPKIFGEESVFTAAVRLEHVELGAERDERVTFGLNFRPIEETVFKLDYQLNFEDGSHGREDNDALLFSIATYF